MNLRKRTAELLEQGHHIDRTSQTLNLLLILLISMNVVAIFLETVDSIYAEYLQVFWYFEVFSVAVFTIEYLARVWSSIDLEEIHDSSPIRGRVRYILSPIALRTSCKNAITVDSSPSATSCTRPLAKS